MLWSISLLIIESEVEQFEDERYQKYHLIRSLEYVGNVYYNPIAVCKPMPEQCMSVVKYTFLSTLK